ncbi:phage tail sheath family protein [Lachnospiraceae bacterium]|nr:phage tail sheath family protein [Lachnospiraceae bacterium]
MTGYKHGAYVQEADYSIPAPKKNESGLHVFFGTAPINQAAEPEKAVNQLIVAKSYEEAVERLGYSEDFEKYTLCQVMDAYFKLFGVGPVVFCNVLDCERHVKENEEKECQVTDNQAVVNLEGILPGSLAVKNAAGSEELVKDVDYITSFNEKGHLVITLLASGKGGSEKSLKVASKSISPDAVQEEDIIGGINVETGKETGLELVRRVYPRCGMFPGLIAAPGWCHKKNVAAVMAEKCREINGVFRCECLIDIDTDMAKKYMDCERVKEEKGLLSETMIVLWPMALAGGKKYYYSAVYGAMTAKTDADNDSIPTVSPSNRPLYIDGAVLMDGTEINLDQPEANTLNGQGIVTILNNGGLRSWGNNTAAYPSMTKTKDRWINCRRAFSWWGNSFIVTCRDKVDDPANYQLIESIVDAENIRGNSYVQQGKFAGIRMEYDAEENRAESLLEGKILVRQYIAPFTPAEYILNILSFDPSLLENALGGSQQ